MKEESRLLLLRAEEAIDSAELLLNEGYLADSISRAYYAMFYIAEALLNEKDLSFSKHGNVHGRLASITSRLGFSIKSITNGF